jgi:hypothetical protein
MTAPPALLGPWPAALAVTALAAALSQTPAAVADGLYAARLYPALQAALTGASNLLPLAIFDVVCVALLGGAVVVWWRAARAWRAGRSWSPIAGAAARTLLVVGLAVLWFQLVWGLN